MHPHGSTLDSRLQNTGSDMPELDTAKLQYWIDRNEIRDVIMRYPRGLDRHDDEILASVYHPDAIDHHGRWVSNRDDFVQWANHVCHNTEYRGHTHNMTSHTCHIDGDTAHSETYAIWVLRHKDGKTVRVGGGRYIDRLERKNGEWRISLRRLIHDWRFEADGTSFNLVNGYQIGTWDKNDPSYERPLRLPLEVQRQLESGERMRKL
jgi:hypothetical protein